MSQLHRTLYTLKGANLVQRWNAVSKQCAEVWVTESRSFWVMIADDYYGITITDVIEAHQKAPTLRYVIVCDWQNASAEAEVYCKEHNINIHKYAHFRYMLHQELGI